MSLQQHLRFTLTGFSPSRVALVLCVLSFSLVPAHFYVSCQMSGVIGMTSLVLLAAVVVLCLASPKAAPRRFLPLALALFAVLAHMLCTH
jgi:hypothetical protein